MFSFCFPVLLPIFKTYLFFDERQNSIDVKGESALVIDGDNKIVRNNNLIRFFILLAPMLCVYINLVEYAASNVLLSLFNNSVLMDLFSTIELIGRQSFWL